MRKAARHLAMEAAPLTKSSDSLPGLRPVNVLGLEAFWTSLHLELHLRAFFKCPVAGHLNGRKVDKHILAAGSLNEAIALGGVKPFHNTLFSHYSVLLFHSRLDRDVTFQ